MIPSATSLQDYDFGIMSDYVDLQRFFFFLITATNCLFNAQSNGWD